MNTALEYSTRVVQEGGRRCKKSALNDLVHLTPLRIPLMNPPSLWYLVGNKKKLKKNLISQHRHILLESKLFGFPVSNNNQILKLIHSPAFQICML